MKFAVLITLLFTNLLKFFLKATFIFFIPSISALFIICYLQGVDLLSPPRFSPVLAHGFAELIKNHLMGRRASSQLSCRCKFCFSSRCLLREAMLAPKELPSNEIFLGNTLGNEKIIQQQKRLQISG